MKNILTRSLVFVLIFTIMMFLIPQSAFASAPMTPVTPVTPVAAASSLAVVDSEANIYNASLMAAFPAAPANFTVKLYSATALRLSWDKVTGASGYQLFRSLTGTGAWLLLGTTTASTVINSGLTSGTAYFYKVRPYVLTQTGKTYGSFSAVKFGVPLATPILSVTNYSSTQLKLSWSAVPGVSGYKIQRALSPAGPWGTIATLSPTTSFINSGLTSGTTYLYRIIPFKYVKLGIPTYIIYGSWSDVEFGAPLATPSLTVSTYSATQLKLSWPAVPGASGYRVQRATSSTGPWVPLTRGTTANSLINSSLATGNTYFYRVQPYKHIVIVTTTFTFYGTWSAVKFGVPMATPDLVISPISATELKVSWLPVDGANGYRVMRATALAGPWSVIADGLEATFFINTGLASGTVYYYKVIPYKNVSIGIYLVRVYGRWSAVRFGVPLGIPGNLKVAVPSAHSFTLSWDGVAFADGYEVCISDPPYTVGEYEKTAATSYTYNGVTGEGTYRAWVRAYKMVGSVYFFGPWSPVFFVHIIW